MRITAEGVSNRERILELAYEAKTGHIGSCFSAVDIIGAVYDVKKDNEKFVLSSGHSAFALYSVLESRGIIENASGLPHHPERGNGIDCSTGSLGQGLPIACGMALADRRRNVYCLVSDGECGEGSIWETLRIGGEQKLDNLKVIVNANGYSAYDKLDVDLIPPRLKAFGWTVLNVDGHNTNELREAMSKKTRVPTVVFANTDSDQLSVMKGIDAHYKVLGEAEYLKAKSEVGIMPVEPEQGWYKSPSWSRPDFVTTEYPAPERHQSQRGWFSAELFDRMKKNKDIWLVSGDLGYKQFDGIRRNYPDRFLNTGAAEQAMMGIGVGLAMEGKIPFVYSITPFLLYRPFETIRNYVSNEGIPVRMIGSGRDTDYGDDGFSHHAEEDRWISRILGLKNSYWPETKEEIPAIMDKMITTNEPHYLNLQR